MTYQAGRESPTAFVRRYTKTWIHALATAALTAFGTLTFIDTRFAAVAIAAYTLPPLVLYFRGTADTEASSTSATASERDTDSKPSTRWSLETGPTESHLNDATIAGTTAYAVGEGGVVLTSDDAGWSSLLSDGPRAQSTSLRAVDSAGDDSVWTAGASGTVARIDVETGQHTDYSEPASDTSNLVDIAAATGSGGETVFLADGSGRIRRGMYHDGEMAWDDPVVPGSGSSIAGLTMVDDSVGWVCDTSQQVFRTTDGGRTFEQVPVDAVSGTMTDVTATAEATWVTTDDGLVYHHDGDTWTPRSVADGGLQSIAGWDRRSLSGGDDGTLYERDAGQEWERALTPTSSSIDGVAVAETSAVAVGAGGTVLERQY